MDKGSVHQTALTGFAKDPKKYDRARPSYPAAAVERIITDCKLDKETCKVVDIACGTGKFTSVLAKCGIKHITAVEPVADMRKQFSENFPDIPCIEGTAANTTLETASVDVVCVAQAFHWFATEESVAEFARILKPNGYLVLIWNEQNEQVGWVADVVSLMWKWKNDEPQHRDGKWKDVLDRQTLFGAFKRTEFDNPLRTDRNAILDRVFSTSFIAKQPADQVEIIRAGVISTLDSHGVFQDGQQGEYPYATHLYIAQKL